MTSVFGKRLWKVALFGAPGGGKGTISNKMLKEFPFMHVSTGNLLRKHVHEKTELGLAASKFMHQGLLVPDELIIKVLLDEVNHHKSQSIILDGFPRTLGQAQELNKSMHLDLVIEIKVPHEVIVQRMANRWIHMASGRTYSLDYNPPKKPGLDDVTGEPLEQREDDKPAVVKKRLEHYDEMINPLLEYYGHLPNCQVKSFSGTMSDVIYPQVSAYLKEQFSKGQ
eukprot:gene678-734_t